MRPRGTARLAAKRTAVVPRRLEALADEAPDSSEREAVLAALNGIRGNHLKASVDPLAITMTLRVQERALDAHAPRLRAALPAAGRRVAVLMHGLATNDRQRLRQGHHHGALLETLAAHWALPLDPLPLVGHSMGGLGRAALLACVVRGCVAHTRLTRGRVHLPASCHPSAPRPARSARSWPAMQRLRRAAPVRR